MTRRRREEEEEEEKKKKRKVSRLANTFSSLSRCYIQLVSRYSGVFKNTPTRSFLVYG